MANKKKHKFSHTHIEHHGDGSHTVHHVHEEGPHKDVKAAVADHDGLMDHMMDHTSEPNDGEGHDAEGNEYAKQEAMEEKIAPGIHSKMAAMGGGAEE